MTGEALKVSTIQIRNPRVIEVVLEERAHGVGRGVTETAENLILSDAERRRLERATRPSKPSRRRATATASG